MDALFLTFASPSLAAVVAGLPNDHYHAFADPMVFVLVGLGAGALWRVSAPPARGSVRPGRAAVVIGVGLLLVWNVAHQPPAISADGGFPAADRAAKRIAAAAGDAPIVLRSLPGFKSAEAYAYPLARAGVAARSLDPAAHTAASSDVKPGEAVVDHLRRAVHRGDRSSVRGTGRGGDRTGRRRNRTILRFEAAPGRFISVYPPAP